MTPDSPLPDPPAGDRVSVYGDVRHSDDNMRRYGRLCANAAIERCAVVCESVNNYDNPMTATDCATAIRQLKDSHE